IAHSASAAMHEQAAAALGLRCHYQFIEVAGAGRAELLTLIEGVRRLGFAGVNITFPYKEAIIAVLDELAPTAAAVGAVNTVVVKDQRLVGNNTDTTGFERAVTPLLTGPENAVAVIGAGGVGKAIAFALSNLNVSEIRIFDSDPARSVKLGSLLPEHNNIRIAKNLEEAVSGATGVVNATPVGMLPNKDSPVPVALLHSGLWVADAVYYPLITPLLAAARASGARTMTGRELAIHQAAHAFELFTGFVPSIDVMGRAFDAVMGKRTVAPASAG
ncbi:MAG: shikimate dehydrogenase, partial [Methylobacteriaceae bacterium]|nr:shikimate dehydrogenase [Methylobacteriaceae bacterium]